MSFSFGSAEAISVSNVDGESSASANRIIDGVRSIKEFNAEYMGSSPISFIGDTQSFDSHFAWQSAQNISGYGPANVFLNVAGFDLTFTVEDPLNEGYTIDADALVRGYRTAMLNGCSDTIANPYAAANGSSLLNVRLDVDGTGFGPLILPLVLYSGGGTSDKIADGIALNDFTTDTSAATLGTFVGTHTFTLRISNAPSSNTTLNVQNYCLAETAVRFGLNPTMPGFVHSLTPGSDGESLSDLGLFVGISVTGHGLPDLDGDGFTNDVDCDDLNPTVYPGAPELFDGLDNDCDTSIDEDILTSPAKGQRSDVNDFLIYAGPLDSRTSLESGTTSYDVMIKYGDTTDSTTFSAILNGNSITHLFNPSDAIAETVSIPLEEGGNVLKLSIDGIRTDGRTATDTDRLSFIVG